MAKIDDIVLLVDSVHGVYAYKVLANKYPLYVGIDNGKWPLENWLINNSDVMGASYTANSVFDPDDPDWCDNLDYLEHLGLFVMSDDHIYWHIESIDGDIFAINPRAQWNDDTEQYEVRP